MVNTHKKWPKREKNQLFSKVQKGQEELLVSLPILVASQMSTTQWWYEKPENVAQKWEKLAFGQKNRLLERENEKTGFFRGKGGRPPYYPLFNSENRVPTKNGPRRMQNESSGAKTRSPGRRKQAVRHRKWRMTTKVVSRATVSL